MIVGGRMLKRAMKMNHLLLHVFIGATMMSELTAASFIESWFEGKKLLAAGDRVESTEMFRECFEGAVEEGNANYAWPAADRTASGYYASGRPAEAGEFARRAIVELSKLPQPDRFQRLLVRAALMNMVERGHQDQGRIGEAWRATRLAAAALRGEDPALIQDAPALRLEEIDALPANLHGMAYRIIERHAEFLDLTGRSDEALAVLAPASAHVRDHWADLTPKSYLYAAKIRSSHINLLDFLGYKPEAIQQLENFLEEMAAVPSLRGYRANQRLNLLRHISQWEGPSEEILRQVREAAAIHKKDRPQFANATDQFVARMEMDLHRSQEALRKLEEALSDSRQHARAFDSFYQERDHVSAKMLLGEVVPDSVFAAQIEEARRQGNKRAEPTLYTIYATHLVHQGRATEALPLYREALRLVRSFGRPMHQFGILCGILNAGVESGDKRSIEEGLAELEAVMASAEDRPDYQLARIALSRASALIALGRPDEAKAVLEAARKETKLLPDWLVRTLRPDVTKHLFAQAPPQIAPAVEKVALPIKLQPVEVLSMAAPFTPSQTRVTVGNPSDSWAAGSLVATGPGAAFKDGHLFLDAALPVATAKLPLEIPAGHEFLVPCGAAAAADGTKLRANFRWSDPATDESSWEIGWSADASGKVVLDASLLGTNPFRSITLYHQVALPKGHQEAFCRLVAPQPMRLEYYDAESSRLLAIDANGNGDFTEVGDFLRPGPGQVDAVRFGEAVGALLEVNIFGLEEDGLDLADGPVILRTEVWRDKQWTLEAESVLQEGAQPE